MIYIQDSRFPITRFQLFFKGGLLLDPPNRPGLTLITQRQCLRGTRLKDRHTLLSKLESMGTDLNLISFSYALGIGGLTLTRHLPNVFDLIHEMLSEPLLSSEQIEQEKRRYQAELESLLDEDGLMAWLWMGRRLYRYHPFWNRLSVTASSIQKLTTDDVVEHWKKLFNQDSWMPCISGSISKEDMYDKLIYIKDALSKYSVDFPKIPVLSPLSHRRLTLINQPNRKQVHLLIAYPTLSIQHPHRNALNMAVTALGGTFSSPLMQEIRVKRGLSYGAQASLHEDAGIGLFVMNTTPEVVDFAQTIKVMIAVLQRGVNGELTDQEIDFARQYLVNSHPFKIETSAMRASLIARSRLQGIDPHSQLTLDQAYSQLDNIDVNQAANQYLSGDAFEVVALGDLKQMQSQLSELQSTFDQIESYHVADDPLVLS